VAGCSSSDEERQAPRPITAEGLEEHLRALDRIARRNGGERAVGTPGYAASVRYVAGRLRHSGWRVSVQEVPLRLLSERSPARLASDSIGE
jgi:hypothetical protein